MTGASDDDEWGPFGERVRAARLAAGIPVIAEAGRRAGIFRPNWSRMENRGIDTTWTMLRKIVSIGLGLEYFFPSESILAAAERIKKSEDQDNHR
jgi:transcriptional regulator with XRE-family HTH domain